MDRKAQAELFTLLNKRIGIRLLPQHQQNIAERFISARVIRLGLDSPQAYLKFLADQPLDCEEFYRLIATVTNAHTFFFRDADQLSALRSVLTNWKKNQTRPIYLWSAGCATGEEPYTLALLCAEQGIEASILATDINRESLRSASQAVYRKWALRHLPSNYREKYFTQEGQLYRIHPDLRLMVKFRFHNLVEGIFPRPPLQTQAWDLILCRNVLIYFNQEIIDTVINGFLSVLDVHSYLFLGASETLRGVSSALIPTRIGSNCVYCRGKNQHSPIAKQTEQAEPTERWMVAAILTPTPAILSSDSIAHQIDEETPLFEHSSPSLLTESRPFLSSIELPVVSFSPALLLSYEKIVTLLDEGNWPAALVQLQSLLKRQRDHLAARITMGNLHFREGRIEEALHAYRRAQDQAPLLPEIHYLLGIVFRRVEDWDRARIAFRRALFLEPHFWSASYALASVCEHQGDLVGAKRNWKHCLDILIQKPLQPLFLSYVKGIKEVDLLASEIQVLCRQKLAAMD